MKQPTSTRRRRSARPDFRFRARCIRRVPSKEKGEGSRRRGRGGRETGTGTTNPWVSWSRMPQPDRDFSGVDELVAAVWRAANAADVPDSERKKLSRLIREMRKASDDLDALETQQARFRGNLVSALEENSQLAGGLTQLRKELGRPPSAEEFLEHVQSVVSRVEATNDQPLLALSPEMGFPKSIAEFTLAEFPAETYEAIGHLAIRFGQLEESVTLLLVHLSGALGRDDSDCFTDDLSKKRQDLRQIMPRCKADGVLSESHVLAIDGLLELTVALARERRRFIHASYILPVDSPSTSGWIRQADRGAAGISLEPLDVEMIAELASRTKAAAEAGWALFYAVLRAS
jgi:hypothetical protein